MTSFDMTESIAPKSDQLNADDMLAAPATVTITEVRRGTVEQPFEFHLKEFPGRPYKPSKSMRRVMAAAWGLNASTYVGKRLTLYTDPDVKFGGATVGGIKISEMSDLKKPLSLALTATRGKRATHVVKPLAAEPVATVLPVDPPARPITSAQFADIGAGLVALGITDGDVQLATVSQVIGRDVTDPKHLTRDEATKVLAWIKEQPQPTKQAAGNDWPETAAIPGTEQ